MKPNNILQNAMVTQDRETRLPNNISYSEKLRDSRWIEKRLRILERDSHKCQVCGVPDKKDNHLHIHHFRYHKQPWDVKDESLITLCARCHRIEEHIYKANYSLHQLAKETLIPALVLNDILIDMTALRRENLTEFREHINQFLYKQNKRTFYRLSL